MGAMVQVEDVVEVVVVINDDFSVVVGKVFEILKCTWSGKQCRV